MTPHRSSPPRPRWRALPLWLRRLLLAAVAVELLYLIAGNAFLWTELGRQTINRKPEKYTVSWQRAWTWVPFWVHARELELSGRARRVTWRVKAESARVHVWLPSLARRHVHFLDTDGRGVEVDVDLIEPQAPPPDRGGKRRWRVTVGGGDLARVERLRLGDLELSGRGAVSGSSSFQVRGPVELRLARVRFTDAHLTDGGATAASELDLDTRLEIGPFVVGSDRPAEILSTVGGEVDIEARSESLAFLNSYLSQAPWLRIGGSGHLRVDAELSRGWLKPGSALALTGSAVEARLAGLRAHGEGRLEGRVPEGSPHTELELTLDRFAVDRESDGATLVEGEMARLVVTNDSQAIDRPAAGLALEASLPPARVPDFAAFSRYIPAAADVELYGGDGELSAEVRFDAATRQGDGWLALTGERVSGRYGDLELRLDLDLRLALQDTRLDRGTTGIAGSTLRVDRATLASAGEDETGWWARVEVPEGRLWPQREAASGSPLAVDARLEAALRDSRPLVALWIESKPKLEWFERLLKVEDVVAGAQLRAADGELRFRNLAIDGGDGRIELLGELDLLGDSRRQGVLFARYRKLSAAVALTGRNRDWKLIGSRDWYRTRAAAFRRSNPLAAAAP